MHEKAKIPKGGFTLARKTFTSSIWLKESLYLKLWVWIIGRANHEDVERNGFLYKRGQVVTTYNEIIKALTHRHNRKKISPSLKKVRIMLEWLANEGMIRVEPVQDEGKKSTNPHLAERCRTGADTGAETGAYVGIKIIAINYDTYQDLQNYKGRHRDKNLSEQGHNNNNDYNNNDNLSVVLYEYYVAEISPSEKAKQRAVANIKSHLKNHPHEDLKQAISNYKTVTAKRDPQYRKNPANFFGKRESAFIDYLPANFQANNAGAQEVSEPQRPPLISFDDPESIERLYSNE